MTRFAIQHVSFITAPVRSRIFPNVCDVQCLIIKPHRQFDVIKLPAQLLQLEPTIILGDVGDKYTESTTDNKIPLVLDSAVCVELITIVYYKLLYLSEDDALV